MGQTNKTFDYFANLTSSLWIDDTNSSIGSLNEVKHNQTSLTASRYLLALKILKNLNLYYLGTIAIVGLLGNGYNCVSFLRVKRKLRSPSYYLASLAMNDVIFMVILLLLWLNHFNIDLFNKKGLYQTLFYFSSTSSCISGKKFKYFCIAYKTLKEYKCFSLAGGGVHIRATYCRSLSTETN